jgi:hypothetical protein
MLPFQIFYCFSNLHPRTRVHAVAVKESLNRMLGYS